MNIKIAALSVLTLALVSFVWKGNYALVFDLRYEPYELTIENSEFVDTIVKVLYDKKYIIYHHEAQTGILLETYDSVGRLIEKSEYMKGPDKLKRYIASIDPVTLDMTYSALEYYEVVPSGRRIFYDTLEAVLKSIANFVIDSLYPQTP